MNGRKIYMEKMGINQKLKALINRNCMKTTQLLTANAYLQFSLPEQTAKSFWDEEKKTHRVQIINCKLSAKHLII